jgi:hypothetical protein
MSNKDWLRELASSYGPVSMVELIPSTIASGRVSGFIHMSYEVQADNLIKQLCNISIDDKFLFAKKEEVRALKPQRALPRQPSVPKSRVTVDEEGYATHVSRRRTTTASTAVAKVAAPVGQFALLMDDEEEDEEEEEEEEEEDDLPPPLERVEEEDFVARIEGKVDDSPFSVIGLNPWSNADRRMTMCNELATVRQNEEAEKKALIESRISHIAEKEMQRSLELALAESFEHKSPPPRSRRSTRTRTRTWRKRRCKTGISTE